MFSSVINFASGMAEIDRRVLKTSAHPIEGSPFRSCAAEFGIELVLDDASRNRIPRSGPAIVIANHPTGFAEGVAVPAFLDSIRPDVKFLGHHWFQRWPALADRMFLVDPLPNTKNADMNAAALRAAQEWVREGHMIMFFPAARVARWEVRSRQMEEGPWRGGLSLFARRLSAPVLPISVDAQPGVPYSVASAIHPLLGASLLGREALRVSRREIPAYVHEPVALRGDGALSANEIRQMVLNRLQ